MISRLWLSKSYQGSSFCSCTVNCRAIDSHQSPNSDVLGLQKCVVCGSAAQCAQNYLTMNIMMRRHLPGRAQTSVAPCSLSARQVRATSAASKCPPTLQWTLLSIASLKALHVVESGVRILPGPQQHQRRFLWPASNGRVVATIAL